MTPIELPTGRTADNWIQTFTGKQFFPTAPSAEDVCIQDIAHGLSNLCRFSGQCSRFYSVAEHSVLVSQVVPPEFALQGLMHDACEAYITDIPRPLKQALPEYQRIEALVWRAVAEAFGLPETLNDCVKEADNAVLLAEKAALLGPSPASWVVPGVAAQVAVAGYKPGWSEFQFLRRFNELTKGKGNRCE